MVLTKEMFEETLQEATKKRETPYRNKYAFHFRWEVDDTGAERDFQSFQSMMEICGVSNPDEWVIPRNSQTPEWALKAKLLRILAQAMEMDGRSIIIIHYAGHGMPSHSGEELLLTNSKGKTIRAATIIALSQQEIHDLAVDILFIVDCCWSFLAKRTLTPDARLVEIITAGDTRDPVAFDSAGKASLTSKLFMEIRNRARNYHQFVEFADVICELRRTSPVKKPHHTSLWGIGAIRLPLDSNSLALSNALMGPIDPPLAHYAATFSIYTSHTYDAEQLKELSSWIANLKGDCKLILEYVKETNSMVFIFEAPYTAFLRIQGLPGVTLLAEHKPSTPSVQQHHQVSPEPIVGTENMRSNTNVDKMV